MVANPGNYTGHGKTPPKITAPDQAPAAPVTLTAAYAVAAGQTLYFTTSAYTQDGVGAFTNAGRIVVIQGDGGFGVTGIADGEENPFSHLFSNAAKGVLTVEAVSPGADAYGYDTGSNPVAIQNAGVIQVVALDGDAFGLDDYGGYFGASVGNAKTGLIAVWASGVGYGLDYYQTGVALENAGLIEVTANQAVAVYGAWSFVNSGSIIANTFGLGGSSTAVKIGFEALYHGSPQMFTNSGLIEAQDAFYFDSAELSPPWAVDIDLTNSGRIFGKIDLSQNADSDTILNSGTIKGVIDCGDSIDAQLTNTGKVILTGGLSRLTSVANARILSGEGVLALAGSGTALDNESRGLVESTGAAGLTVRLAAGTMTNDGLIEADGGVLEITGAVTGTGSASIAAGTLKLDAGFTQAVAFTGAAGVLELAQSQGYTGTITGFSPTGGTQLDLADIGFTSVHEATFKGTASGGVLTVTDGAHTARIALLGDYMASSFVATGDGHHGVLVSATPATPGAATLMAPARI